MSYGRCDPGGCVICHGGNPQATTAEKAHAGAPKELTEADGPHTFYPAPGSIFIGDRACGQCHQGYAERLMKSLMNTEAGKLQGNLWSKVNSPAFVNNKEHQDVMNKAVHSLAKDKK